MFGKTTAEKSTAKDHVDQGLFRAMCEYSPNMMFVNHGGRIVYVNQQCEAVMGYTKEEFYSPSFRFIDLVVPEHRELARENYERRINGERFPPYEYRIITRACKKIDAIITTQLIPYGDSRAILGIITDVSGLKRMGEEALSSLQHMSFLTRTAMHFVEQPLDKDIFQFIADQIHQIVDRKATIVVTEFEAAAGKSIIRALAGRKGTLKKIELLLGRNVRGLAFDYNKQLRRAMKSWGLAKIGGLCDLVSRQIPLRLCRRIEAQLNIGDIYWTPFILQGEDPLGGVTVLTHGPGPLPHPGLIESFIKQAAIALRQRRAEQALRRSEEKYRVIVETAQEGIITIDSKYRCTYANGKFLEITGYALHEIQGHRVLDFVHAHDRSRVLNSLESRKRGAGGIYETRFRRKDGSWVWMLISGTPMYDDEGIYIGSFGMISDITVLKKSEEVLQRDKENLERLVKEKTEELMRTQMELANARRLSDIGVLAATIAHEMRNPLAAIKIACYNVRRKNRNAALEAHLANIDKKVMESDQIIQNLLSYSRVKSPNYELLQACDVMKECIAAVVKKYSKWGVAVEQRCLENDDSIIEADPTQLKMLFTNVLDNAFQALTGQTGKIGVACRRGNDETIEVTVKDSGIGIDKKNLKKIFDPFFTNKSKGIGLGMTVSQQIVTLHRGRIEVSSRKNKGTSVKIVLPVRKQ